MSNATNYLGLHVKTGPSSYELPPILINARPLPTLTGMHMGGIAWGLNEGPRRGTGGGNGRIPPNMPFVWDDFVNEHRIQKRAIDEEYSGIFNTLSERVLNEINLKRLVAQNGISLAPIDAAQIDLEETVKLIKEKDVEYNANIAPAHALYGLNPLYLMVDLPFRKIYEGVHSRLSDGSSGLLKAYEEIDSAYKAALELKRISLEKNLLLRELPGLDERIRTTEATLPSDQNRKASWVGRGLSVIDVEKDLLIGSLPYFLQEHITSAVPSLEGSTYSQAMERYALAIHAKSQLEKSAIRAYRSVNLDSPHIRSPMSKPELEALHKLVELQNNTELGRRWIDYHESLLHSETARQLDEIENAFRLLEARAKAAEAKEVHDQQQQDYIDAVSFLTATSESILIKYGDQTRNIADQMRQGISGKKIRSFADAMQAFEKVTINPKAKLNAQDTSAVVHALAALDKATLADNVTRLGKAFGIVGKISQGEAIRKAAVVGFETGVWKPLMLEFEAMAAGIGAGALVATAFALTFPTWGATTAGIIAVAVLMAAAASWLDTDTVDNINNSIFN